MIELRKGDLFDSGAQVLVNTVNCVGVMGKGIALEFKERYPDMFKEYAKLCRRNYIKVGKVWIWHEHDLPCHDERCRYVFNFPTKEHWRNPSKLEWISSGLDDLKYRVIMLEVESIAIPALGCANGGLDWNDVRPVIESKLNDLEIPVYLYEPQ